MPSDIAPLPSIVVDALAGKAVSWPSDASEKLVSQLLECSRTEGVQPLIYHLLSPLPEWSTWPEIIREEMEREFKNQVAVEILLSQELSTVLSAFHDASIPLLVFKGTPIALSQYPAPELRPRCDLDILIREYDRNEAETVVKRLGYSAVPGSHGDLLSYQQCFERSDTTGFTYLLDLHWRVTNSHFYAQRFGWDELACSGVELTGLPAGTLAINEQYALVLSCIHRIAHHHEKDDLLWLYDIHLLCRERSDEWIKEVRALAEEKSAGAVVLSGIQAAEKLFGTLAIGNALSDWRACPDSDEGGDAEKFLEANLSWGSELLFELRALPSLSARLRCLRQHAFPPRDYMLRKYNAEHSALLPVLYFARLVGGAPKLLRRRS